MASAFSIDFFIRLTLSTVLFFILSACTIITERETEPGQSPVVTNTSDEKIGESNSDTASAEQPQTTENTELSKGAKVAGAVIGTVATIYVVTKYIEEKVVPTVLGLAVAYLIYKTANDAEKNSTTN